MISLRPLLALFIITITVLAQPEQHIKVIIPAYNNAAYVEATLQSVFRQNYSNFHVIYFDDNSNDESVDRVESFIQKNNLSGKITLIKNQHRYRKLKNIYTALHWYCDDDDIIVMVDCDDLLIGNNVFNLLNALYKNPDIWLTYGQDNPFPKEVAQRWGIPLKGNCCATPDHVIQSNSFRSYNWIYMHLRSFRAWLFKAVQVQDLLTINVPGYRGTFYPACNDYAMYYPMLEMCGRHSYFNPQVVYAYNCGSPINGFKIDRGLQTASALEVRNQRRRYYPLSQPIKMDVKALANEPVHILLINTTPSATAQWIEKTIVNTQTTTITLLVESDYSADYYRELGYHAVLKNASLQELDELRNNYRYCCIATDMSIPAQPIDFGAMIATLERTKAHCFQWGINPAHIIGQEINTSLFVAQLAANQGRLIPNTINAGLYRTNDLLSHGTQANTLSIEAWLENWQKQSPDHLQVILYSSAH